MKAPILLMRYLLQWKMLNVFTLGNNKSDNINLPITRTDEIYLLLFSKWTLEM
jgi:hypothetical protein